MVRSFWIGLAVGAASIAAVAFLPAAFDVQRAGTVAKPVMSFTPRQETPIQRGLRHLNVVLESDYPALADAAPYRTAQLLREAIYTGVPLGAPPKDADYPYQYGKPLRSYLQAFYQGYGTLCGGYSQLFVFALEARGIDARRVGMWAEVDEARLPSESAVLDGHVSVEVKLDGKWIAMDPTFNVVFKDEAGNLLNWPQIRDRYQKGLTVIPDSEGSTVSPQKSLATYYIGLDKLTKYMTVGLGEPGETPVNLGWDGILHYRDGHTDDYAKSFAGNQDLFTAQYTAGALAPAG
jgi:hypothetical protein